MAKAPKRPPGRKSTWSEETAKAIADRLATGEPMAVICRDEKMPAVRTVHDWMAARPEFAASIARAREEGFDALAAQCLEIADETAFDNKETDDGRLVANTEWISRSKLRVETRLKLLAKWDPKRYGDKVALTGGDGGPVQIERIERVIVDPKDQG